MITGNRVVHPTSTTGFPRVAWAYLPEALEADRRLTDAVHEHGAAIFAQLNHFGLNATSDSADDLRVLWGPSAVKSPAYGETPKAMEPEDIREVVEWWGRSAELSREGGFDGTEVHISHSYLLHQFLSPLYNKRTDEYGGSFENRLRFAREVIDEVRRQVGEDWVVGVRISLSDFIPGALDIEDAVRVAQELEADGQIDYVNVTAAGYHNIFLAIQPSDDARRLPRRADRPGEGGRRAPPGVHRRRDQGPGARGGDPRVGEGGHGRDDARADRRPGVREQGA